MDDEFKIIVPALIALFGVFVGQLTTLFLPYLRHRLKRIEAANRLCYWLFELYRLMDKYPVVLYTKEMANLLRKYKIQIDENELVNLIDVMAKNFFRENNIMDLDSLKVRVQEGIEKNISTLIIYDPLLASKISAMSLKINNDSIVNSIRGTLQEVLAWGEAQKNFINKMNSFIEKEFSDNDFADLIMDRILKLSMISGIFAWLKTKKHFRDLKGRQRRLVKEITTKFIPIIENLINTSTVQQGTKTV